MIIYVAMVDDRHTDPEPYPFTTAEAAIIFAKEAARRYASDPKDITEEAIEGWLYYARYGEDSAVWVLEKVLGSSGSPTGATE